MYKKLQEKSEKALTNDHINSLYREKMEIPRENVNITDSEDESADSEDDSFYLPLDDILVKEEE